jgi:hypothetical protein
MSHLRNYKWLTCFAFRQKTRVYADHEQWGHVALVTATEPTFVQLVIHNLYRVEVIELMHEDFCKLYHPDFASTPDKSAKELRNYCHTGLLPVPPALELIERIISSQPSIEEITVMKTTAATKGKEAKLAAQTSKVHADFNRRTCIEISRDDGVVRYIPLTADGFEVETATIKEFEAKFKLLQDYPADKAAKLYAEYTKHLGATKEVMQHLAKLCNITDKEIQMATAKKAAKDSTKAAAKPAAKAPAKKAAKPAAKAPAKKTAPAKTTKPAANDGAPRASASQMFKDLIMEGKLTDDQIFAKVQAEYNLDEKKRGYVKWYRNDLEKKGMNPPAAKA